MDTTYKPSYTCKVISSFIDNYSHIHKYEMIKKVTLRKEEINSSEKEDIYKMFLFFNIILVRCQS